MVEGGAFVRFVVGRNHPSRVSWYLEDILRPLSGRGKPSFVVFVVPGMDPGPTARAGPGPKGS
jgi:hypothetical protein